MAKCSCGKPAVIEQKYANKSLCESCFKKSFEIRVARLLRKNIQIKRNEHISVGVSGGKDSAAALYYMHKFTKRHPFKLDAILIDEGIKGYRDKSIKKAQQLCDQLEVPLHIYPFKDLFNFDLEKIITKKDGILPCSYCGVFRRKALNTAAKELKTSKLVIGHNLDDEAQVILMNFLRGDTERSARLGFTNSPVYPGLIQRIKPLRTTPERETLAYALINKLPIYNGECPYAETAFRNDVRNTLNQMEERYPGTKYALLNGFDKSLPLLKKQYTRKNLNKCEKCGEPTSSSVCKACDYLATFKKK